MQLGHGPLLVLKVMITGTFLLKKDMYIKNFGFTNHLIIKVNCFCNEFMDFVQIGLDLTKN